MFIPEVRTGRPPFRAAVCGREVPTQLEIGNRNTSPSTVTVSRPRSLSYSIGSVGVPRSSAPACRRTRAAGADSKIFGGKFIDFMPNPPHDIWVGSLSYGFSAGRPSHLVPVRPWSPRPLDRCTPARWIAPRPSGSGRSSPAGFPCLFTSRGCSWLVVGHDIWAAFPPMRPRSPRGVAHGEVPIRRQ